MFVRARFRCFGICCFRKLKAKWNHDFSQINNISTLFYDLETYCANIENHAYFDWKTTPLGSFFTDTYEGVSLGSDRFVSDSLADCQTSPGLSHETMSAFNAYNTQTRTLVYRRALLGATNANGRVGACWTVVWRTGVEYGRLPTLRNATIALGTWARIRDVHCASQIIWREYSSMGETCKSESFEKATETIPTPLSSNMQCLACLRIPPLLSLL